MIGPVPVNATLKLAKPENIVSPTYMRLSGTSFAAPIVAGAAAQILARQPNWTPDQVKGALMQRARFVPEEGLTGAAGVGEINASRSADLTRPGNPNLALNRFVVPDPIGVKAPVFDAASWTDVAKGERFLGLGFLGRRHLERRILVIGDLERRHLERRHLERRDLERRARGGRSRPRGQRRGRSRIPDR